MPVTNKEISSSKAVAVGALAWGPLGTPLPTDSTTTLNVAMKSLGYVGSGGILRPRDISTDETRDMNGDVVYVNQTDFSRTYQAELLQNENADIKRMIFGSANVVVTPATSTAGTKISVSDKGLQAAHGVLVGTTFDGTKTHREVVEDAQPISVEQGPLVGTAIRSYTVTWRVFKNAAGIWVNEYDDDGVFSV